MVGARVERKLTAILAADVAGYSRLIGADEEGTLARLKAHRREVIDPKIAKVLRPHQIEGVKVSPSRRKSNVDISVSLSCYDRKNSPRCIWMYHGRRNGSGKDSIPSSPCSNGFNE